MSGILHLDRAQIPPCRLCYFLLSSSSSEATLTTNSPIVFPRSRSCVASSSCPTLSDSTLQPPSTDYHSNSTDHLLQRKNHAFSPRFSRCSMPLVGRLGPRELPSQRNSRRNSALAPATGTPHSRPYPPPLPAPVGGSSAAGTGHCPWGLHQNLAGRLHRSVHHESPNREQFRAAIQPAHHSVRGKWRGALPWNSRMVKGNSRMGGGQHRPC